MQRERWGGGPGGRGGDRDDDRRRSPIGARDRRPPRSLSRDSDRRPRFGSRSRSRSRSPPPPRSPPSRSRSRDRPRSRSPLSSRPPTASSRWGARPAAADTIPLIPVAPGAYHPGLPPPPTGPPQRLPVPNPHPPPPRGPEHPEEGVILKGTVRKLESFGAFVEIPPFRSNGLVHLSQIAKHRVEAASDVLELNQAVWVKVIKVTKEQVTPTNIRTKISLSIKYVDQSTGEDRDPEGIECEAEERKRRPKGDAPVPVQLSANDAALKTTCPKCGGRGHLASECYNKGQKYDLLEDRGQQGGGAEGRGAQAAATSAGRGRGAIATLPSWMTEGGGAGLGGAVGGSSSNKKTDSKADRKAEKRDRKDRKAAKKAAKAERKVLKAEKKRSKKSSQKAGKEGKEGKAGKKGKSNKASSRRRHDTSSSESSADDGSETEDEGAGPRPAAVPAAAPSADAGPAFVPAARFGGAKKGYVFHNGAQGIGYYLDAHRK